jgi:surface carbohydrate biosynthesis protein
MKKIIVLMAVLTERDNNAIFPVIYYLQKKFGFDVTLKNVLDYKSIIENKYDAAFFANIIGEKICIRAAKFCKKINLPVISLTMEGNVHEKKVALSTWGYNLKREDLIDLQFVWSDYYKKIILNYFPKLKKNLQVSGSTGFDRYKLFNKKGKELLIKYNKNNFNKIITYATWGFDKFVHKLDFNYIKLFISKSEINKIIKDRLKVKSILKKLIKNNPNILFILKIHPRVFDENSTEFNLNWFSRYNNVLILQNEENLKDLINISDIWIAYQSTTFLEAWCMNKITIKIIPTLNQKWRNNLFHGSVLATDYKELQNKINEFYKTKKIDEFENKNEIREKIIENSIQSKDGLNSYRTAIKINDYISNKKNKVNIKFKHKIVANFWNIFFKSIYLIKFLKILTKYKQLDKILSINKKGPKMLNDYYYEMNKSKLVKKVLKKI